MDPERARIQADLSGQLDGEIRCDDTFLQMYASDASIYEIKPLGVVRPANVADVVACVNYAREHNIPIFPRGSGSNVVGGAIGAGLVLDFSFSMHRVLKIDRETVEVEAGVVLADLNKDLLAHGRQFGPDPDRRSVTTVGGFLAMNSSGSHWIKYGAPREKVLQLKVVMADGKLITFTSANAESAMDTKVDSADVRLRSRVGGLLQRTAAEIEEGKPKTLVNHAGYNVFDLQQGSQIDLTRLLTGSEGTLGIIVSAVLQTEPIPRHRGVALLFFHRLESAAKAAVEIGKMKATACDLVDRRFLSLAREMRQDFARMIPGDAEAMLLVEFHAHEDSRLREKLEHLIQRIVRKKKLAFDSRMTTQIEERNLYWRLVRRVIPSLFRMRGSERAIPFVEDIGIDPQRLPDFLKRVHKVLNEHDTTALIFSHTPQGLVHIRPLVDLADDDELAKMQRLASDLFAQVLEVDGTISGAHGDGLSRTWFLRTQYGKLYNVFSEIKNTFDPQNIFNPGKIVGHPYSGLTDNIRNVSSSSAFVPVGVENLEANSAEPELEKPKTAMWTRKKQGSDPISAETGLPILQPELNWDWEEVTMTSRNCNGCGRCRTSSSLERMCPIFRLAPREEASPRAKANLMRGIATGQLDPKSFTDDEFKSIADLCVNCHQCRIECPASVDIPKLMIEAKAQYFAVSGQKFSDWMLMRLDWLYKWGGRLPGLANFMISSQSARWVLDRLFGIAQGRKLPSFAKSTFSRWATRQRLTETSRQQSRKVVYFHDAYVNWNDVELGQAFVEVMKHNGIEVVVPSGQSISGMSMISDGAISRVRGLAESNVELLAEWVRSGYKIVTTEPSAALALTHEYLHFLDEPDAKIVAENTIDASSYLWSLHESGDLELDFSPENISIGYHLPCHQRALAKVDITAIPAAIRLLRLIPGLQVEMIERGCSGMAGTFGLKRKNYRRSLRTGLGLINAMQNPDIFVGATECSTCKIQMEQGTTKPTIHPVKILCKAYGLMPNELSDLFGRRSKERVIS